MGKIALNWTIEVILNFISIGPLSIAFFLTLYNYIQDRNRPLLLLLISWFWLILWSFGEAVSYLYLSKSLFILHIYSFIGLAFFMTALVDSLNIESIDPIKTSIFSAVSAIIILTSVEPDAVELSTFPNGDATLAMGGYFRITTTVIVILIGFMYVYYMAKIHWNAPSNLKFYSRLNLLGAILIGILPGIFVALGVTLIIPGCNQILISTGALLSTIAFISQPKLAYILPFKALRLTVVQIDSGISLYSYTWSKSKEMMGEPYFSGMLVGISQFAKEALGRGNISEIHLEDAILIFKRSSQYPVACVLFATKSSPSLKTALNFFAERFFQEFAHSFVEKMQDLMMYVHAIDIVSESFPFVPEYD